MEVRTVRLKICFQSRFIHHTPLSHFTVSDFGKQHAVTIPLHQRTEFGMLQFQTGVFIVQNRFYCKSLQLSVRPCRINSGKSGKLFSTVCLAIQCKQYTGSASFGQQFVDTGFIRHIVIFFLQFIHKSPRSFIHSMTTGLTTDYLVLHPLKRKDFLLFEYFHDMNALRSEERTGNLSGIQPEYNILKLHRHLQPTHPKRFLLIGKLLDASIERRHSSPFLCKSPVDRIHPGLHLTQGMTGNILGEIFKNMLHIYPARTPAGFHLVIILPCLLLCRLLICQV